MKIVHMKEISTIIHYNRKYRKIDNISGNRHTQFLALSSIRYFDKHNHMEIT